jgi:hypothetical protein
MATVPTSEVSALAILSFFKAKVVRPNDMLAACQVNQQFLANGGKLADYAVAFSTPQKEAGSNRLQTTDSDWRKLGRSWHLYKFCVNFASHESSTFNFFRADVCVTLVLGAKR